MVKIRIPLFSVFILFFMAFLVVLFAFNKYLFTQVWVHDVYSCVNKWRTAETAGLLQKSCKHYANTNTRTSFGQNKVVGTLASRCASTKGYVFNGSALWRCYLEYDSSSKMIIIAIFSKHHNGKEELNASIPSKGNPISLLIPLRTQFTITLLVLSWRLQSGRGTGFCRQR